MVSNPIRTTGEIPRCLCVNEQRDGKGHPWVSAGAAWTGLTSLRLVLLRLALVVEAHGALVHPVSLHAILAAEATRVVCGDRAAGGEGAR